MSSESYHELRARRALTLLNDVLSRTRKDHLYVRFILFSIASNGETKRRLNVFRALLCGTRKMLKCCVGHASVPELYIFCEICYEEVAWDTRDVRHELAPEQVDMAACI